MDLGLESVGFKTLFATDIDFHSCKTLTEGGERSRRLGLPFLADATVVQKDIRELSGLEILKSTGKKPGEISLLAGGPPCQAFSVFGKRKGLEDPRGTLVYEYLRIISEIQPQAFVFENVYGLLTIENGEIFRDLCKRLEHPGKGLKYTISFFRLNAADYCVPQSRDRVFIVGTRNGEKIDGIQKICGKNVSQRTVQDALRSLPKMGAKKIANHTGREHSERIIERYSNLAPGERDSKTRINKLDKNRPSYTIIVGSDKGGGKGHVHPDEPREVTPRESARIQTFPDWWAFSGTSRHPIRQIGNAVPPMLAVSVGRTIAKKVFGIEPKSFAESVKLLGQEHLFKDGIPNV